MGENESVSEAIAKAETEIDSRELQNLFKIKGSSLSFQKRHTTITLSDDHYKFLHRIVDRAVQQYGKKINISDIIAGAIELYREQSEIK